MAVLPGKKVNFSRIASSLEKSATEWHEGSTTDDVMASRNIDDMVILHKMTWLGFYFLLHQVIKKK